MRRWRSAARRTLGSLYTALPPRDLEIAPRRQRCPASQPPAQRHSGTAEAHRRSGTGIGCSEARKRDQQGARPHGRTSRSGAHAAAWSLARHCSAGQHRTPAGCHTSCLHSVPRGRLARHVLSLLMARRRPVPLAHHLVVVVRALMAAVNRGAACSPEVSDASCRPHARTQRTWLGDGREAAPCRRL
jgi:hypothetical protein